MRYVYEVLYASFVAPLSFQMREECQYYLIDELK